MVQEGDQPEEAGEQRGGGCKLCQFGYWFFFFRGFTRSGEGGTGLYIGRMIGSIR